MRIERAGSADAVAAVQPLFDHALRPEAVERFLADPTHHLLVAYSGEAEAAAGFVSGVEMTHPDKGTEMFLYELAVEEASRNQGIGRVAGAGAGRSGTRARLLRDVGADRRRNPAALRAYAAAAACASPTAVLFTWTF